MGNGAEWGMVLNSEIVNGGGEWLLDTATILVLDSTITPPLLLFFCCSVAEWFQKILVFCVVVVQAGVAGGGNLL